MNRVYYSMAGRSRKSKEWGEIAYNRNKSACTACNLACDSSDGVKKEELLREALQYDPDYTPALRMLSDVLAKKAPNESTAIKFRLVSILEAQRQAGEINIKDLRALATNTARPYMTPRSGILSRQGIGYSLYVVYNVAVLVRRPPRLAIMTLQRRQERQSLI